jgi:hypothetical protein
MKHLPIAVAALTLALPACQAAHASNTPEPPARVVVEVAP